MGKATYEGLRKPDDPIHKEQSIVIGGGSRRTSKRSKQASSEKGLSQKGEGPGPKKEQ